MPKQEEDFLHQKQKSVSPTLFSWSSSPSKLYPSSRCFSPSFLLPFLLLVIHPQISGMLPWPSGNIPVGISARGKRWVCPQGHITVCCGDRGNLPRWERGADILMQEEEEWRCCCWDGNQQWGEGEDLWRCQMSGWIWWCLGGVGSGEGQDARSWTRMADIGTDKRGLVSRRDFCPTEKPC